jgi:hypothetical protein
VLDVADTSDRKKICKLLAKVKHAVLAQRSMLMDMNKLSVHCSSFQMDMRMYHVKKEKDVVLHCKRSMAAGWYHFMDPFVRLWACEALREHVVFPIGWLKDDKGTIEGVVFPKLSNDWAIGLPVNESQHAAYCTELLRIVTLMHREAGVVHMDLLPCNIAWCYTNDKMSVRLLDFDAALPVGWKIGDQLISQCNSNAKQYRWPGYSCCLQY